MSLRLAIIGAGIAGVSAGRLLADRGYFAGDALSASGLEDAWLAGRSAALKITQS